MNRDIKEYTPEEVWAGSERPGGSHSEWGELLKILVDTSFNFSPTPIYPLSSGVVSQYYIDCKMALSYPRARQLVGELILEHIDPASIDAVGGLALGAYPIAIAVSDAIYRKMERTIKVFVIRKQSKPHGLKKYIEGDVKDVGNVLIVDDVVTSGQSTVQAIEGSRREGLQVVKAVAIIDRQESNGRENIERCGVPFEALCTLRDLHIFAQRC